MSTPDILEASSCLHKFFLHYLVALSRVICIQNCHIQGVPESIDYFSRGDRGTPDEQKIIWEGGV